ncbi:hypothetical protein B0T10DRAFT_592023 [Thelonectria olida]|uniref:Uncharacterized protein n=1 Tax=Thelonectria olida TaxID=1576542 RepID=A0A9P8WB84_9HYPO|nr:hypothetical protein B0T10DRAFT_592023 [Thelonectria olida]
MAHSTLSSPIWLVACFLLLIGAFIPSALANSTFATPSWMGYPKPKPDSRSPLPDSRFPSRRPPQPWVFDLPGFERQQRLEASRKNGTGLRQDLAFSNEPEPDPIPELSVSINQTNKTKPPKINVKITNNNNFSVTIAPYLTPLDEKAAELGLFDTRLINMPVLEGLPPLCRFENLTPKRLWQFYGPPPNPDLLIELGPGQSQENEVGIGRIYLPGKTKETEVWITMRECWVGVWPKEKEQVAKGLKEGKLWRGEQWLGYWKSNSIRLKAW